MYNGHVESKASLTRQIHRQRDTHTHTERVTHTARQCRYMDTDTPPHFRILLVNYRRQLCVCVCVCVNGRTADLLSTALNELREQRAEESVQVSVGERERAHMPGRCKRERTRLVVLNSHARQQKQKINKRTTTTMTTTTTTTTSAAAAAMATTFLIYYNVCNRRLPCNRLCVCASKAATSV